MARRRKRKRFADLLDSEPVKRDNWIEGNPKKCKFYLSKLDASKSKLTPDELKLFPKHLKYDTKLALILHGEPIADSRPRVTRGTVFSKNIGIIRSHFYPLYIQNEMLRTTLVDSPFHLKFRFYMSPSSKLRNSIMGKGKIQPISKEIKDTYLKDKLHDFSIKDCDNMVKVYNDLFMTERAKVTLDDGFNVGIMSVDKYISENPRTEIEVYYSSNPSPYYRGLINAHSSWFKYKLSEKNMYIFKRTHKEQIKWLEVILKDEFSEITQSKQLIDKLKQVTSYIEDNYSAELIFKLVESIGVMKDFSRLNRTIHTNTLLMHLFRKNKTVYTILNSTIKKYENMIGGLKW